MNRRCLIKGLFLVPALAALAGCGSSETELLAIEPNPSLPTSPQQVVLSATEARDALASDNILLLAAESVLEASPAPLLGGAIRVDVDALTVFSETPDAFDNVDGFQQIFRSWGVRADTPIIIYDNGDMKFAARVHFLLSHFGGPESFLVNGGAPALTGLLPAGGGRSAPSEFVAQVVNTPIALVFQEEVLAALNTAVKIVDVRSPAEFNGTLLLPGDARPGHIPGAINLPESLFFDAQGQLYDNSSLLDIFHLAGLTSGDPIIVYCHDGAKSSLAATLLVQTGFARTSLYYLSYRDWSENFALPVEV